MEQVKCKLQRYKDKDLARQILSLSFTQLIQELPLQGGYLFINFAPIIIKPIQQARVQANYLQIQKQENGSYRVLVPIQERKMWLQAPVGEQKLYRNVSYRGLVPIGRWNIQALVSVRDLLVQGIYQYRGFISVGDLLEQGTRSYRGFISVGDLLKQGTKSYRGFIRVGDLFLQGDEIYRHWFLQGIYLSKKLVRVGDQLK